MFSKILIANRGEIACRIIRTARKLGILTVAVYSDADQYALHVQRADEAIHIGAAASKDSYLQGARILAAALKTGAQAIHPGYGFLSENAEFCRQCQQHDITFIGPGAAAIDAMGSKSAAKHIMGAAGVPLVPGYHEDDQDPQVLRAAAQKTGYPVLLKATAGGGGKGMRIVNNDGEFSLALAAARRESANAFGDDTMLVEKYLIQPRHVEIQVFCDRHGNAVYLFERDCSVQRRHQKIIEEAPAPGMTVELRAAMGEAAVRAARAIDYEGAGTVEFLLDADGGFYFMEMNTRLQVEHPVTEMISGQDLVEWQLKVAAGDPLPLLQADLTISGHAFEARIYAEDPEQEFLPQTGILHHLRPPGSSAHVRVDSGVVQGDEVSVYYDPMIAKLIVWDENRGRALQRLQRALRDFQVAGVTTNISFLYNLAACQPFVDAELDTGFIDQHRDRIFHKRSADPRVDVPMAALCLYLQENKKPGAGAAHVSPWACSSGWKLNQPSRLHFRIKLHGEELDVAVEATTTPGQLLIRWQHQQVNASAQLQHSSDQGETLQANIDGHRRVASIARDGDCWTLFCQQQALAFEVASADFELDARQEDAGSSLAPMNGTIVALLAEAGAAVEKGDPLLVMEAMKMEHTIKAPARGKLTEFYFAPGDLVNGGVQLFAFDASNAESE